MVKKLLLHTLSLINSILRTFISKTHKLEMQLVWSGNNTPAYFNHYYDMYYKWRETKDFFWLERAMFNSQILTQGGNLLEIGCGDGFNSNYIYSGVSNNITAIDSSFQSIIFANKFNNNPRVNFKNISISNLDLQESSFNNIVMDAVIEQLSIEEQNSCLNLIANLLTENGIFSGVTILKNENEKYLKQNKNQFDYNNFKQFIKLKFDHFILYKINHFEKEYLYFAASKHKINFNGKFESSAI